MKTPRRAGRGRSRDDPRPIQMENAERLAERSPPTDSAEAIIAAERKASAAKTARLREARLAKEAVEAKNEVPMKFKLPKKT
jgi:hypothetical protein